MDLPNKSELTKRFPNIKLFKSPGINDLSLTEEGFNTLETSGIYEGSYKEQITETLKTLPTIGDLLAIRKFLKTPFYVSGSYVWHFDKIANVSACFCSSFSDVLRQYKKK